MDSLAASGRFAGREASKGKTTAECVSLECTQSQFASLQERWKALLANGERWGELLEKALPEMEKLQVSRVSDGNACVSNGNMRNVHGEFIRYIQCSTSICMCLSTGLCAMYMKE